MWWRIRETCSRECHVCPFVGGSKRVELAGSNLKSTIAEKS